MADKVYDVIVVGAGNAALSAAMAAKENCESVLVVEKAPDYFRGGNTYFTGGIIRFAFNGIDDIKAIIPDMSETEENSVDVGKYTEDDYYDDMMRVTHGLSDPELAQILVSQSHPTMKWLRDNGVRFVLSFGRQAFKDGDKYRFWGGLVVEAVGAGKGLSDQQFEICQRNGVEVRYATQGVNLIQDEAGRVSGLRVLGPEGFEDVAGRSVVLASGGFEANAEMRCRYLGPGWELVKVRGVPYNTGDGIRMALEVGAQAHGHYSSCHAVAWDMNAPAFGDRVITELFQKHSYPFGLIVNINGERFLDEGYDFRNYTYVTYGRALLTQPQGLAFQIFDEKVKHLLRDEYWIPQATMAQADTLEELAAKLDIDPQGIADTIKEYNAAVRTDIPYNPTIKDGRCTEGLALNKTNWAETLDTPPYYGWAVTTGISFTFGGVKINTRGQIVTNAQDPIPGLYAAGEMVGGLFYYNYPGGSGLSAGMVFGRLSGASAAEDAMKLKDL
ncbi:MAG: FAD-dependent tricarballylate dehydrogenase TcuA [Chloroflexi bacterium]|nr:FAD-dependent tricarballylate dehydrogenase TcuA [Chloroflexota bacterium]